MSIKYISFLLLMLMAVCTSHAQQQTNMSKVTKTAECADLSVHAKLVDLNKALESENYKLAFFYSGNVPSKALMSVRLDCKAGERIAIRYVVGKNASRYQLNVIDPQVQHVVKAKAKTRGNELTVVEESFTAKTDGVYVLVYSQTAKEENCIGLSVFKK